MKKKILIVDDEYTIRELVDLSLVEDYEVIKAEDGEDAIKKIRQSRPDLIILDIMMPKMDGYQVCRTLKTNKKTNHIPVIILTAKHMLDDLKSAIEVDADEFITKPFEPDFLKKRVDAYLNPPDGIQDIERKLFQHGRSMHYIKGIKKPGSVEKEQSTSEPHPGQKNNSTDVS